MDSLIAIEKQRAGWIKEKTRRVLQEIIQETTNHINRMQVQRSATEVEKEKMDSLIAIEKQRAGWIKDKTANDKALQAADGEAEGQRLAQSTLVFLEQLNGTIGSEEARVALLRVQSAAHDGHRGRRRGGRQARP